jgi:predicted site-specific integrase-resolvase
MKERDLSPAETARKLGISLEYAYRQIWAGRLPANKREGRWYVPSSEVERRVKERLTRQR